MSFLQKIGWPSPLRLEMKLDVYEVVYTVVYDNEFSLQKPLQLAFKMKYISIAQFDQSSSYTKLLHQS